MERKVYGPVKLPSGKEISFVEPLGRDRMDIMARALAEGKHAEMLFMVNTYWLPGKCLVDAEGKFIAPNYSVAFDDWSDPDLNFYRAVFNELFGWTDGLAAAAREEAARFFLKPATL